jgi:hypothetical protein
LLRDERVSLTSISERLARRSAALVSNPAHADKVNANRIKLAIVRRICDTLSRVTDPLLV